VHARHSIATYSDPRAGLGISEGRSDHWTAVLPSGMGVPVLILSDGCETERKQISIQPKILP
jgi:hypothetical protein